jgi:DNA-binding XRE family transcriptional regulator
MAIEKKIGLRIKEIRTKNSPTQEQLAWEADFDRPYMNHVENGGKNSFLNYRNFKNYLQHLH